VSITFDGAPVATGAGATVVAGVPYAPFLVVEVPPPLVDVDDSDDAVVASSRVVGGRRVVSVAATRLSSLPDEHAAAVNIAAHAAIATTG
jgi:hypothetical protein